MDDTDDRYMGDNRDGDEKWYQYRTQEFCANAAYSLYGSKKGSSGWSGCSRRHFINSFFTYGGADNLLQAAGKNPIVYYDDGTDANYYNNTPSTANAVCVAIDMADERRELNSRDQDEDGYVSTLGCDASGNYVIAGFESNNCDGNYFSDIVDTFDEYNKQHNSVGCHLIWGQHKKNSYTNLEFLLTNSWSCDLDLYPNGCPDPYGEKERWDFAIRTVAQGGNAQLAYKNMVYKRPLRILSWCLASLATITLVVAYLVRNRERIHSKGGKYKGVLRCILEDFLAHVIAFKNGIKKALRAQRDNLRRTKKRRRAKKQDGNRAEDKTSEEPDEDLVTPDTLPESSEGREKKRPRSKKEQRAEEEAAVTTPELPSWANVDDEDDRQIV